MIDQELRLQLEAFIEEHEETPCGGHLCTLRVVDDYVQALKDRKYPTHEVRLLGLAFRSYCAKVVDLETKLEVMTSAIAAMTARCGGEVTIAGDEVRDLNGLKLVSYVDPDKDAIFYTLSPDTAEQS